MITIEISERTWSTDLSQHYERTARSERPGTGKHFPAQVHTLRTTIKRGVNDKQSFARIDRWFAASGWRLVVSKPIGMCYSKAINPRCGESEDGKKLRQDEESLRHEALMIMDLIT